MEIVVFLESRDEYTTVSVEDSATVGLIRELIQSQCGVVLPPNSLLLAGTTRYLSDSLTLSAAAIDGSTIIIARGDASAAQPAPRAEPEPAESPVLELAQPSTVSVQHSVPSLRDLPRRQQIESQQSRLAQPTETQPGAVTETQPSAVTGAQPTASTGATTGDASAIASALAAAVAQARSRPQVVEDDPETQARILEEIRRQNIQENIATAMENNPEGFAQVHMLYIPVELNQTTMVAFVDCGAQASIISTSVARKAGLERLIDTRFQGVAMGVGSAAMVGKVHMALLKIENQYFGHSFYVLNVPDDTFLLGLDFFRKYRCIIDLSTNCLSVDDNLVSVGFLPEHLVPVTSRLSRPDSIATPPSPGARVLPSSAQPLAPSLQEQAISSLVQLGASEEDARAALQRANGDPNAAASLLFGN